LVPLEEFLFKWVRGLSKAGLVAFDGVCIGHVAFDLAFPLIWTKASSFKEAEGICMEHAIQLREDNPDVDLEDLGGPSASAGWPLRNFHFINVTATAVSLVTLLVWLHCSSHRSEQAVNLDRKRMSNSHLTSITLYATQVVYLLCTSKLLNLL
jgi:hypothetical protein